jgi:hypothetical protein
LIDLIAGGNITLAGNIETNQQSIIFNRPVNLRPVNPDGTVSVNISGTGDMIFNNTVDGTYNLSLNPESGIVQFNNLVGGSTALNNLRVQGDITTTNPAGINIRTVNNIETGVINSSSSGNGGNINLNAGSDITVSQINAQSLDSGRGGNVEITANNFFQATSSFADRNGVEASISTAGGTDGGTIIIRHGGGGVTPFIVGNATTNGTQGAITRGNAASEQTIFPTQEYLYTHTQDSDRIQIISVTPPPSALPDPLPLPDPRPLSDPRPPSDPRPLSESIPFPEPIPLPERGTNPLESLAILVGDTLNAETQIEQDSRTGTYNLTWQLHDQSNFSLNVDTAIGGIDKLFEDEYEKYFRENLTDQVVTTESLQDTLKTIESQSGKSPVVIYARSLPNQLELVLVRPEGPPIGKVIPKANALPYRRP